MAETDPAALIAPTTVNGSQEAPASHNHPNNNTAIQTQSPSSPPSQPKHTPPPATAYPVFIIPEHLPCPPFIDVSGIPNFRSLGGYLTANGTKIIRPNLYYRCAHPTQITPEGLQHLTSSLGVKAIYDLRSGPEVARTSAGVIAAAANAAFNHNDTTTPNTNGTTSTPTMPTIAFATPLFESLRHFNPVYATQDSSPEVLARKLKWYTSSPATTELPYTYSEGFVNAYRDIALHGVSAYTTMFRHIIERPDDPFVFHCTAGKDRTGVFAALLLRLAGVDDETICWEYAITEPGLGDWRKLFINRMSGGSGLHGVADSASSHQNTSTTPPPSNGSQSSSQATAFEPGSITREEAARVCGSRASSMRAWLTLVLDGEFGGAEKYLTNKCGFSEEEVAVIKRNLVVDLKVVGEEAVVRPCKIEGWSAEGGCVDI